jgi:diacylglycerol kinase (ATP)
VSRQKIKFIVNPISGLGRQKLISKILDVFLNKDVYEHSVVCTEYAGHAKELTKIAVEEGYKIIVAVGGDGTVNEVASNLLYSDIIFGIIPAGSGNGLAGHLKIPVNIPKAIGIINKGHYEVIDTGMVNSQPFMMATGCGFDAHIAHEFAQYGKRGFINYAKLVLKEFKNFSPQEFHFNIDGVEYEKEAFMLTVANSSQFGNNAKIAPLAKTDDNILNVILLKKFPANVMPDLILRLFNRTLHHSKYVETFEGKNIKISQKNQHAQMDGEPVALGNKLDISINPLSLKVICKPQ